MSRAGGRARAPAPVGAPGAGSLGAGGRRSRRGRGGAGGAARAGPAGGTRPLGGGRREPSADKSGSRPAAGWGRDRAAAPPLPGESSGKRPGVGRGFRRPPGPGWAGVGVPRRAAGRGRRGAAAPPSSPPGREGRGAGLGRRPSPLTCSSVKRISLSAALDAISPGFEVRTWAPLLPPPPAGRGAREAGPGPGLRAHRGRGERSVLGQAGGGARGGRRRPLYSHGVRGGLWGAVRRVPRGSVRSGALSAVRRGALGAARSGAVRSPPCGARRALLARARRSALAALGPPRLLRLRPPPMSHHLAVTLSQRRRRFAAPGARDCAGRKSGLPRRRRAARAPRPTCPARAERREAPHSPQPLAPPRPSLPPAPHSPHSVLSAAHSPQPRGRLAPLFLHAPLVALSNPLGSSSGNHVVSSSGGGVCGACGTFLVLGAAGARLSRAQETGEALSLLGSEGR